MCKMAPGLRMILSPATKLIQAKQVLENGLKSNE